MAFPALQIGDLSAPVPIVQGGMGVGISLHRLASAVANEGGIGVIAAAMIGMRESDVGSDPQGANIRALRAELRKARELSGGVLGVNIMVVLTDFASLVRTSIEEKADVIFAGAGLPMDLPKHMLDVCEEKKEEFRTKLVPIVSSARAAGLICKKWLSRFGSLPDAFVVEGPKAGGHLGFKPEDLDNPAFALEAVVPQTVEALKAFEDKKGRAIPVIAAGGVYSGADIKRFLDLGAAGVQMGTRFAATHECDADIRFKQSIVNAGSGDITIIKSPVGLPGRAIKNRFLEALEEGGKSFRCIFHCISTCDPKTSPYCIAAALLNAMKGNLEKGFTFTGSNAFRVDGIVSVGELIGGLRKEFDAALDDARKELDAAFGGARKELDAALNGARKEFDAALNGAKAALAKLTR